MHKVITILSAAAIALILTGCDNGTPMDRDTPKVGAPADTVPPPQVNGTGTDTRTGTDGTGGTQNPPPGQP